MKIKTKLIDWFRGYSDIDLINIKKKIKANTKPGACISVTKKEQKMLIKSGVL